ncbi:MAG: hypothetical protein R6V44_10585 [Paracoccaceae bacterium]
MNERDGGADGPREGGKEDVLASIRRIVREEGGTGGAPDRRDGVLTLSAEMRIAPGRRAPPPPSDEEEAPLTLDAAMRVDREGTASEPESPPARPTSLRRDKAGSHAPAGADADATGTAAPAPAATDADAQGPAALHRAETQADDPDAPVAMRRPSAPAPAEDAAPAVSRAELRAMVRDAIREELSGELGVRVSANIKLLVEREVRKAMEALEAEVERADSENPPER